MKDLNNIVEVIQDWACSGSGFQSGLSFGKEEISKLLNPLSKTQILEVATILLETMNDSDGWNNEDVTVLRELGLPIQLRFIIEE